MRDDGRVGISVEEAVSYTERALDQMTDIVAGLGDDLANRRPDLPGANSPYAILRHCIGVMEFWAGHVIAGREVARDRDAEFRASGPVSGLIAMAGAARRQFRADAATTDPGALPRRTRPGMDPDELEIRSQGSALLHVLEEVVQHLGHMELTRDILRKDAG
jgi:Protein of unknown function (DUF664)